MNGHTVEVVELGGVLLRQAVLQRHPTGADSHAKIIGECLAVGHDLQGPAEVLGGVAVLLAEHLGDGEVVERVDIVRFPMHDHGKVLGRLEVVVGDHQIDHASHEVRLAALRIEPAGGHQFLFGQLHLPQFQQIKTVHDHVGGLAIDLVEFILCDPLLAETESLLLLQFLPVAQPLLGLLPLGSRQLLVGEKDSVDLNGLRRGPAGNRISFQLLEWIDRLRRISRGAGVIVGRCLAGLVLLGLRLGWRLFRLRWLGLRLRHCRCHCRCHEHADDNEQAHPTNRVQPECIQRAHGNHTWGSNSLNLNGKTAARPPGTGNLSPPRETVQKAFSGCRWRGFR
ncbi:MAG: hypothetical protein DWH79_00035 [Planctomycetota bacterium]|nr:MAG: hypothetical protein DWH79_00035 [Planctomycetota bacterium]